MFKTLRNALRARRTFNELSDLSDRQLVDIGVSRYELRAISKGEYRR